MNEEIEMERNEPLVSPESTETAGSRKERKRSNAFSNLLTDYSPKKLLSQENYISALPFILFISGLAMVYIYNSYYAEKTIREIDKANSDLKEMRSEFISVKSKLMLMSKQSQVATQIEYTGLKESIVPPRKIMIKPSNP